MPPMCDMAKRAVESSVGMAKGTRYETLVIFIGPQHGAEHEANIGIDAI